MTVGIVYGQMNMNTVLSGDDADRSTLERPLVTEDHSYEALDMTVVTSSRFYEHLPGQDNSGGNDSPYATVDETETRT